MPTHWDPFASGLAVETDEKKRAAFDPFAAGLAVPSAGSKLGQAGKLVARGATAEGIYAAIEGGARLTGAATVNDEDLLRERAALQEHNRRLSGVIESPEGSYAAVLTPDEEQQLAANERRLLEIEQARKQRLEGNPAIQYADATASVRQQIREALPVDANFARSKLGMIAQGVGQAAGTLPAYVVPGLGPAAAVGQLYDEAYQDALSQGADAATAHSAAMKYLPAAGLDVLSDKLVVGKILKPLKGKVSVGQVLKDILVTSAAEGATEGGQQLYLNAIAKKLEGYDPARPFDQEVYDSVLVGAVVGGVSTATGQAGAAALDRLAKPQQLSPSGEPGAASPGPELPKQGAAKPYDPFAEGAAEAAPSPPPPAQLGAPSEGAVLSQPSEPFAAPAAVDNFEELTPELFTRQAPDGVYEMSETLPADAIQPVPLKETGPDGMPADSLPASVEALPIPAQAVTVAERSGAMDAAAEPLKVTRKGARFKLGSRPDGVTDILDVIQDLGGVAPKSKVRNAGGEYDGFAGAFGRGAARILVRKGAQSIDSLLNEINNLGARDNHERGMYNFQSADDLYAAVLGAVKERARVSESMRAEQDQAQLGAALFNNEGRQASQVPKRAVDSDSLHVGATFRVKGEPFKVTAIDADTGAVIIQDGPRYGTQTLPASTPIFPDKQTLKQPRAKKPSESMPFARRAPLRTANELLANPDPATYEQLRTEAGLKSSLQEPAGGAGSAPNPRSGVETAPAPAQAVDPNQAAMFARRKAPLSTDQADIFDSGPLAGGKTGGDTTFNLAGETAKDFTGIVDRTEALRMARQQAEADQATLFARRTPEERHIITAEMAKARARWRAEAEAIAPGLMQRFRLKFGDPAMLVREGKARADELTGYEQAMYDGHERALYLFDQGLKDNSDFFTRLNLLHEMAHAHWDTLPRARQVELASQWQQEVADRKGPLFDGRKQLRDGVAQGIATDIKEWYAERVAWENHNWARTRAAGQDVRIFGPVARAAQAMRLMLAQLKDWVAQLRGQTVDVDFHRFLDQGDRFEQAPAMQEAMAAVQRDYARRGPGSAHEAVAVADRMRDAVDDIKGFLRRELTSRGHLPEEVYQARVQRDGRVAAIEQAMKFTLKDLDAAVRAVHGGWAAIPVAEQAHINEVLGGRQPVSGLDARLQRPVEEMRRQVDILSRRLVREGVVGGDLAAAVAGNVGFYLNRSYRKFDDPAWFKKVDPAVVARAESFIRAELKAEAPLLPVDEARVKGLVEYLLTKDLEGPEALFTKGGDRKDLKVLTKRKEIAPEIRDLLGEYHDPRVNYARSVAKMAQILETHRYLTETRAAGMGKFLHPEPRPGFAERLAAEGSKALAPLDGLYTSPEIAAAFRRAFDERGPSNPAWKAFLALNGWTKTAKTVLHPITQVRNFVANFGFLVANGHYHAVDGGAAVLQAMKAEFGRGDAAARDYLTRLARRGIVGESIAAGEIREALQQAGVKMTGIEQWTEGRIAKAAKLPYRAAVRLYRLNDEIFKIYAYENEVARWREALPQAPLEQVEKIAAERVQNTLPTYSRVPHAAQFIRRVALLGSFVGFPAEVVRTGYHTIRYAATDLRSNNPAVRAMGARRLAGIGVAATIFPAASMVSRWVNNVDDKDEKDVRLFLPEWTKNSQLLYTGPNKEGRYSLVDLSYLDPWAYLRKPALAAMRGENWEDALSAASWEAASPFLSEGVLAKVLLDLPRNRDDQGRPIYDVQAGPIDRSLQMLEHVWQAVEPGFITQAGRMVRAANGEVSQTGRAYNLSDELQAIMTGARSQSTDISTAHYHQVGRYAGEMNLATITYHRVRDRQGADPAEVAKARAAYEATRTKLAERLSLSTQAAQRLGVSQSQILANLKASGLSKAEVVTALTGMVFPVIDRPVGKYEQLRRTLEAGR